LASRIVGWVLIFLGVLAFLVALWSFVQGVPGAPPSPAPPPLADPDLQVIADILDAIARILENFARLSLSVQWALLGLGSIGLGAFFLSKSDS
jgi:hypothetical protein